MTAADEPIYKVHAQLLAIDSAGGVSAQPLDDDPDLYGTPDDAITPPESLTALAGWSKINGTRASCIRAMVRNTVGLGYEIMLAEGAERDVKDAREDMRRCRGELEALCRRDKRMDRPTFTALLAAARLDYEEVGQGYIEVARDRRTGRISGLFYAPSQRIRRRKDRKGWLMVGPDGDWRKATRFVNFGDKVLYTRAGEPYNKLAPGAARWDVNELIQFRQHTSESRDYGLPADVSLAFDYLGDKLAAQSNVSFFDSSGTAPTIIFVQGVERADGQTVHVSLPPETAQRIAATMKSGGGHERRVAVIPIPAGTKAEKMELGRVSDKDMGFTIYRGDLRQRVLSAFRLSPIFIALATDGRYDAEVERAITKEQVFDGEQTLWEERIQLTILRDMGFHDLGVIFNDLAIENDSARREGATRSAEAGTITRREFRKAYGYPPLPEAAAATEEIVWRDGETYTSAEPQPGEVPHGWNDALVHIGQPSGAENRTGAAEDQRGLKPGVGGRTDRGDGGTPRRARTDPVEATVTSLQGATAGRVRGGARRATARARTLVDED